MGILNLTPDSFSDGGRFVDPQTAIAHATTMIADGADIIDIGAESTRPYGGMRPVTAEIERERLEPVLPAVVGLGKPVSIDTMKAVVLDWAIRQGAAIANDVWGLQRDPDMARVVADHGVPVIVMHNRDEADPAIDIVDDMLAYFERSLAIADKAGVLREQIVIDPGIGFGKTPGQSVIAVAQLSRLRTFGLPILIGLSRKRFISSIVPSDPDQRLGGSIAGHLLAVQEGATIVRTHDVYETMQALRVAEAIQNARTGSAT
ncbi:MAG TPA: dihydropteroate synthase [Pseudorhodoplanes sp.]|nr:dihydropteroate synthase [Pseudorhodoplanes sp.]HWV55066.1 dihydropteroate synthase [Pseudorhodoplanes sp.]